MVGSVGLKIESFSQVDIAAGIWEFNAHLAELVSSLDSLSFADYWLLPRAERVKNKPFGVAR